MRKFRSIALFLVILLLFVELSPLRLRAAEQMPIRAIYVVYDDSGSMIFSGDNINNGEKVDTWCKAKYSMEVFAAMLGANDTMKVYVMSDIKDNPSSGPRLVLDGSDDSMVNVGKIHNMVTSAWNTPFASVKNALRDLEKDTSDEKWLVILTDGVFDPEEGSSDPFLPQEKVDSTLQAKSNDINIVFLGMGQNAAAITNKPEQNIYYEHAETNDQILSKITGICSRIFDYDRLAVDANKGTFSFDIPMSELIVFAQGENANINGLYAPDGSTISYIGKPVSVKYSLEATTNGWIGYADPIIDRGLEGYIATFRGLYDAGSYRVDVSNAKTLEIYYKPAVEITAYLQDENGTMIPYAYGVPAGDYILNFGFVKKGTDEPVPESPLLGNVKYSATMLYNGESTGQSYLQGSRITIQEGHYQIDVSATYLKYNTLDTSLDFDVYRNKELQFIEMQSPTYTVTDDGLREVTIDGPRELTNPVIIKVTLEGEDIPADIWKEIELPILTQECEIKTKMDNIYLELIKGEEPGILILTPKLEGDVKEGSDPYGSIKYSMVLRYLNESELWYGDMASRVVITDGRSNCRKFGPIIRISLIALLLLLLILAYVPGIKHYLPKGLVSMPLIKCSSRKRDWEDYGRLKKNLASTICPLVSQRGKVTFLPTEVDEPGVLELKAIKGGFEITNTSDFAGNENIRFDGSTVPEDNKTNLVKNETLHMMCEKKGKEYSCVLNQK